MTRAEMWRLADDIDRVVTEINVATNGTVPISQLGDWVTTLSRAAAAVRIHLQEMTDA